MTSPRDCEFAICLVRLLFPEYVAAEVERQVEALSPEDWEALKAELMSRWTSVRQTVLDFIARREGRDLAINYIARGTKLSFQSVVNAINYLVKSGLVVRTHQKASKRTLGYPYAPNRYKLTKKGRAKERPTQNKGADLLNILSKGIVILASDDAGLRPTLAPLATQAADADFQRPPLADPNPTPHERGLGDVHTVEPGRRKQSAPAATGKRGSGGETPRVSKPETPEEKAVLDLYEHGIPRRCKKTPPDTWHDRGRSLRSLRRFEHKHPGVPLAVLLEYLKNAFASDRVFPLKEDFFYLADFLRNWQRFMDRPLKKPPTKKSVAQVVREKDQPIREDIRKFARGWWQEQLDDHRVLDFARFTKYNIDMNSDEVCLDFFDQVSAAWHEHMENGNTVSPAMLMTKVIDACMELPKTPIPSDFIPHRDRLRGMEAV